MPATPPWLASAEAMFNRSIDGSSHAAELARRLNSTSLQIDVEGFIGVRAAVQNGRLALMAGEAAAGASASSNTAPGTAAPADAVISGSARALLALMKGGAPATASRSPAVTIRGDAEIANLYRQFFIAARPDPEEELSRWIGDAPARGLSRLAGGALGWARRTHRVIGENIAEYLKEESRDLPTWPEVEEFLQGVDQVREAADRVEARLQGLQRRLQGSV
jgi:ubiquinone biosynthesis protein UbiJ